MILHSEIALPGMECRSKFLNRWTLHLLRSKFHVCIFVRIMMPPPSRPVDAVSIRRMFAFEVQAIQVGRVADTVPPAPLVSHSAAAFFVGVVVLVSGGEGHAPVS